jgi:signal transduction histidine kinase
MLRTFIAKLKSLPRRGDEPHPPSILFPFLMISIALGFLAWRSYQLSVRMESGANTLAQQYAGYAAEITARRVDAAVRSELSRATEDWQQAERRVPAPTFTMLQDWINANEWIVSAMYVPDADPTSSIYVSEISTPGTKDAVRLPHEFYTSTGTVRYTYDPARLLARVRNVTHQQPLPHGNDGSPQPRADVTIVSNVRHAGLAKVPDGFAFVSPLAAPLAAYGTRAVVRTGYAAGSGWENQRVVSLWVSFIALALTALGAYLAWRGLRKEQETMKLRGALIANVSHELRTPLSMIRLGAETLKLSTKLKEKERREIEDQILREVLHLSHLVENVLDVARMQHRASAALALTPVQPAELVTTLVSTYESWIRSKGFTVALHIADDIGDQLWDREAVSRALLNLIDNAIKYSAEEKAIDVDLRQTPEHVILSVSDHGIGIGAKDLARIFDPYYRATFSDTQTRRGAGLGLTLVQQIAASHGGKVEVESEPGVGSTFRLLFPRLSAEESRAIQGSVGDLVHAPGSF